MKTIDLSGMGGGYENVCQQMLKNGTEFIEKNPGLDFRGSYSTYRGVYGIAVPETAPSKLLDKVMMKDIEDATGAMHHCVVGHLLYIAENGREKWLEAFKDEPERYFDWDGTVESCPKTDLSELMERDA